jgi:hypothetical protein
MANTETGERVSNFIALGGKHSRVMNSRPETSLFRLQLLSAELSPNFGDERDQAAAI